MVSQFQVNPAVNERMVRPTEWHAIQREYGLDEQELRVLQEFMNERSRTEIAGIMHLDPDSVTNLWSALRRKMQIDQPDSDGEIPAVHRVFQVVFRARGIEPMWPDCAPPLTQF